MQPSTKLTKSIKYYLPVFVDLICNSITSVKNQVSKTIVFLLICVQLHAQPITGIWKGKMGNSRVELKLIRKGDSLIGTSYYYDSKSNYRRYSVKGYFDDRNNDVIWYDDVLIEDHSSNHSGPLLGGC